MVHGVQERTGRTLPGQLRRGSERNRTLEKTAHHFVFHFLSCFHCIVWLLCKAASSSRSMRYCIFFHSGYFFRRAMISGVSITSHNQCTLTLILCCLKSISPSCMIHTLFAILNFFAWSNAFPPLFNWSLCGFKCTHFIRKIQLPVYEQNQLMLQSVPIQNSIDSIRCQSSQNKVWSPR